jgi:hypothetical protein
MHCCAQNAGPKLADSGWRPRPARMPAFGHSSGSAHSEAAAPGTPGLDGEAGVPNGNGGPMPNGGGDRGGAFCFGVPGPEYLSFAGPGGDAFAAGAHDAACGVALPSP